MRENIVILCYAGMLAMISLVNNNQTTLVLHDEEII